MPIDFDTSDMIRQLRLAETDIPERLLSRILQSGPLMIDPLLKLALERETMHEYKTSSNAPVHALRLLGEIGDPRIIVPLLQALPMVDGSDGERDPAWIWDNDLPYILARLGAPAVEALWEFTDSPDESEYGRAAALTSLACLAVFDPEQRDNIIENLRARLKDEQDNTQATYLMAALADLGVKDLYPEIMADYRAKRFVSTIIPASTARQLLLGKGSDRLQCVHHSLTERYSLHPLFALE